MGYESNLPKVKKELESWELKALEAIGMFVDGEAVLRCPVDTGNLRSSIRYIVNSDKKSVIVGTNTEYAVFVEKGTGKAAAQPFLTPAAEENVKQITEIARKVKFASGIN